MKVDLDELKKQLDSNEIINIIKTLVPDLRYSKQNVLQKEREREKPIAELYAKKEEKTHPIVPLGMYPYPFPAALFLEIMIMMS